MQTSIGEGGYATAMMARSVTRTASNDMNSPPAAYGRVCANTAAIAVTRIKFNIQVYRYYDCLNVSLMHAASCPQIRSLISCMSSAVLCDKQRTAAVWNATHGTGGWCGRSAALYRDSRAGNCRASLLRPSALLWTARSTPHVSLCCSASGAASRLQRTVWWPCSTRFGGPAGTRDAQMALRWRHQTHHVREAACDSCYGSTAGAV